MEYIRYILIGIGVIFFIFRLIKRVSGKSANNTTAAKTEAHSSSNDAMFDELVQNVLKEHGRQQETTAGTSNSSTRRNTDSNTATELQKASMSRIKKTISKTSRDIYDYDFEKEIPRDSEDPEVEDEFVRADAYKIQSTGNKSIKDIKERLTTPEGARDAFILSEIFNKKF